VVVLARFLALLCASLFIPARLVRCEVRQQSVRSLSSLQQPARGRSAGGALEDGQSPFVIVHACPIVQSVAEQIAHLTNSLCNGHQLGCQANLGFGLPAPKALYSQLDASHTLLDGSHTLLDSVESGIRPF
jgi:hypothetical protein